MGSYLTARLHFFRWASFFFSFNVPCQYSLISSHSPFLFVCLFGFCNSNSVPALNKEEGKRKHPEKMKTTELSKFLGGALASQGHRTKICPWKTWKFWFVLVSPEHCAALFWFHFIWVPVRLNTMIIPWECTKNHTVGGSRVCYTWHWIPQCLKRLWETVCDTKRLDLNCKASTTWLLSLRTG